MSSPYVKAKARLEALGYQVGKTEHWNNYAHVRMDLFNCIDAVCMRSDSPLLAIQVTDITSVSKRMEKAHEVAVSWVSTGNRFQVLGFTPKSKKPPRVIEMQANGEWSSTDGVTT
jgi:hypothetical protein